MDAGLSGSHFPLESLPFYINWRFLAGGGHFPVSFAVPPAGSESPLLPHPGLPVKGRNGTVSTGFVP